MWVLGDVAMGKLDESLLYVQLLNGTKHLVIGNHDRPFKCQGTKYAHAVQPYLDVGFVDASIATLRLRSESASSTCLLRTFRIPNPCSANTGTGLPMYGQWIMACVLCMPTAMESTVGRDAWSTWGGCLEWLPRVVR